MNDYQYPEWISQGNVSWETLDPAFREYFLRRVGYDINENGEPLKDVPESESVVLEWAISRNLVDYLTMAQGFHQARNCVSDNLNMKNDAQWWLLVLYFAQAIYKIGIDKHWWDNTITEEEFKESYEWAEYL